MTTVQLSPVLSALVLLVGLPFVQCSWFPPVDPPAPIILGTEVLHDHWRRLVRQRVQLSSTKNNTIVDFELVGQRHPDQAVLVFVWHPQNRTVTCIREYMPSQGVFGYGLAAGMVDSHDNGNVLGAARRELQEECFLQGGQWVLLTPEGGVVVDKYCTTRMSVYLVIDPQPLSHGHDIRRDDAEEGMQSINVPAKEFVEVCVSNMTIIGAWASMLALQKVLELEVKNKTNV